MSAAHKWVIPLGALALLLMVLAPPRQQLCSGPSFLFGIRVEMGHHFPLLSISERWAKAGWITAPASECKVPIERGVVLRQCGMVRWDDFDSAIRIS